MTSPEAAPWDGLALHLPGWAGPAALVAALALALALLAWLWAGWSRATPAPPTVPRAGHSDDACPSCGVPLIDHPNVRVWGAARYTVYLDACDEPSRLDRLDGIGRPGR